MDSIIDSASKIVFALALVLGAYIAFHGHLTPGGGFPAGVIMGTAFVTVIMALGDKGEKLYREWGLNVLKSGACVVFMGVIIMGFAMRGWLLDSQKILNLWSGGFTILANLLGSIMVAVALAGAFYYLYGEMKVK